VKSGINNLDCHVVLLVY